MSHLAIYRLATEAERKVDSRRFYFRLDTERFHDMRGFALEKG